MSTSKKSSTKKKTTAKKTTAKKATKKKSTSGSKGSETKSNDATPEPQEGGPGVEKQLLDIARNFVNGLFDLAEDVADKITGSAERKDEEKEDE